MTNLFEDIHADVLDMLPDCEHYVQYDDKGNIVEAWTLKDGVWTDTTAFEQEKQRLERQLATAKKMLDKEVEDETDTLQCEERA